MGEGHGWTASPSYGSTADPASAHLAKPAHLLRISDSIFTRVIAKGMLLDECAEVDIVQRIVESEIFGNEWLNRHLQAIDCNRATLDVGVSVVYIFEQQRWSVESGLRKKI
ncbi:MAG: hypothetical protein H0U13_15725 [Gemmatimonadaceae bacterium]|nr:hypothetical protein [Gemmatimonadaceae bacterium]